MAQCIFKSPARTAFAAFATRATVAAKATLAVALATLALPSCIRDNVDCPVDPESVVGPRELVRGLPAQLTLSPVLDNQNPQTRTDYEDTYTSFTGKTDDWFEGDGTEDNPAGFGRPSDRRIGRLRVLIYHSADHPDTSLAGKLVQGGDGTWWNFFFTNTNSDPLIPKTDTCRIATGKYDFVFIANEYRGTNNNTNSAYYYNTTKAGFGANGTASPVGRFDTFANLQALRLAYKSNDQIYAWVGGGSSETSVGTKTDREVPMVRVYKNVSVYGSDDIQQDAEGGGDPVAIPVVAGKGWQVQMERAAIRLSLYLKLGKQQFDAWRTHSGWTGSETSNTAGELHLSNMRERSYLLPQTADRGGDPATTAAYIPLVLPINYLAADATIPSPYTTATPGGYYRKITNSDGVVTGGEIFVDRIILPEHILASANKNSLDHALRLSMQFDGLLDNDQMEAYIHYADGTDGRTQYGYGLPRNTWIWVDGTVTHDIDITTHVLPWGRTALDPIDASQHNFTVDRSLIVFSHTGGSRDIEIFTDDPDGWNISAADIATLTSNGITLSAPTSGAADTPAILTVSTGTYLGNVFRTTTFNVVSGNLHKQITVIRIPETGEINSDSALPSGAKMYVGAFWKHNQYGERLIRSQSFPSTGNVEWAAVAVGDAADWAVLDTEPSRDMGAGTVTPQMSGNDNGFDVRHRVNSNEIIAYGKTTATDPEVYFRIGLKGVIASDAHRYGQVIFIWRTSGSGTVNMRRIWLRQGEAPDYVMRPDDATNGVYDLSANGVARPRAVKFSPYNLTAKDFNTPGNTTPLYKLKNWGTVQADLSESAFTDYPSQSGAQFRGKTSIGVPAYNPIVTPTTPDPILTDVWGNISDDHESCPEGYRRPADGHTWLVYFYGSSLVPTNNMDVEQLKNSEIWQSLHWAASYTFMNGSPDRSNLSFGYYADGFFDRREMADNVKVDADSSVAAYDGAVFFNPDNGNSLFLPNNRKGGSAAYYLSSATYRSGGTVQPTGDMLCLNLTTSGIYRMGFSTDTKIGASIRCVVDEQPEMPELPDIPVTPPTNPLANAYAGAFWRHNETGERIIRIPVTSGDIGAWTIQVFDYGTTGFREGDIVFSSAASPDPTAGTASATSNAENYKVTNSSLWLRGVATTTKPIFFRVGLAYTLPDKDSAPRYAVLLLRYANNTKNHFIFLRQGEADDYVMQPGDAATGVTTVDGKSRPRAMRFSPFNLTSTQLLAGNTTSAQIPLQSAGGGEFTEFPSQAGALFQWAHPNNPRYAYNPNISSTPSTWSTVDNGSTYWSTLSAEHETCPVGYHRPSDGNTTGNNATVSMNDSEMFQSLYSSLSPTAANTNKSNSVWGFYADGYFDRRTVEWDSCVNKDNPAVAYIGRLFYNPNNKTFNSLFLPAVGNRNYMGDLNFSGTSGRYITSSLEFVNTNNSPHLSAIGMVFNKDGSGRATNDYRAAYSIRCVVDVVEPHLIVPETVSYGYLGAAQQFNIVSYSAPVDGGTAIPVAWKAEFSTDDGSTWAATPPTWLAGFPTSGAGATNATAGRFLFTAKPAPLQSTTSDLGVDEYLRAATSLGSEVSPKDLTKEGKSANCYVVNAPGWYRFPLYYGNARNNTSALAGNFVDYKGVAISSTAISNVADAKLVWQDAPNLVDPAKISVIDMSGVKWVKFYVDPATIMQGNAVIAIRANDTNKTVMWSWHIWVTSPTIFNAAAPVTIPVTNRAVITDDNTPIPQMINNIPEYNLGWRTGQRTIWVPNPTTRIRITQMGVAGALSETFIVSQIGRTNTPRGNNPFWQWGRHAPMPPSNGTGSTEPDIYWGEGFSYTLSSSAVSLRDVIQHPDTFYATGDNSNWNTPNTNYNLWDASNPITTGYGASVVGNVNTVKSVYDPNPIGFKMATPGAWTGFLKSTAVISRGSNSPYYRCTGTSNFNVSTSTFSTNRGWMFYPEPDGDGDPVVFFPASGVRTGSGVLANVTQSGSYLSALPINTMLGFQMNIGSSTCNPVYAAHKAAAGTVRSVAE